MMYWLEIHGVPHQVDLSTDDGRRAWYAYLTILEEDNLRKVAHDRVTDKYGRDVDVSTVFLFGIDFNHSGDGPPLLYETMVFPYANYIESFCDRYTTRAEAAAGHAAILARVLAGDPEVIGTAADIVLDVEAKPPTPQLGMRDDDGA